MILTPEELTTITGRKNKSKQIEVLRQWGIPFRVNALGKPVVLASAFAEHQPEVEPDFSYVTTAKK